MDQRPPKLLYIEDDPALVRLVDRMLARRGYEVEHAGSAEEGLARLEQGGIDVIALDHYLPVGTGIDLLRQLKGRDGVPPIVYVTGSAETAVAVDALKAGAADYVLKTIGDEFYELLASAIDQALEKSRLLAAKARAEREVREARDRAEILLGEVNHRVANSLALVASLVRMQAGTLNDPAAINALTETQARITAIAGVHRRLYTSANVGTVDIEDYLRSLVDELGASMNSAGHQGSIKLDTDPMSVSTDKAVSIGVIVTELVTNALKYAYEGEEGEVRVGLRRHEPEGSVTLVVEDDGIGWTGEGEPRGTGVGSRIVRAMATTLGCTVEYDRLAKGTRARLAFQL